MAEGLRSIDQIGPGFQWNFPRLHEELNWERWYNGRFDTMFPPASIDNGRSLLAWDDIIKINMPRVFSKFYEDAIMSERPVVTGSEADIAWLAENGMSIWERIGRAVEQWSIFGLGVLASYQDATLRHIGSPNYFRVGDFADDDLQVGHIIAYPHAELRPYSPSWGNPGWIEPPNRLRIIRYMPTENINDVTTYLFSGGAPDGFNGVVGGILQPTRPAGITHLATFGYNDSWYADARDLMARLMLRLSLGDRELNRFLNRITLVPPGILADLRGRGDTRSDTEILQAFTRLVNPTLSDDGESGTIGRVQEDLSTEENARQVELIGNLLMMTTGVPPSVQGTGIAPDASGTARDKAQDPAKARVSHLRRHLAAAIPLLIAGMGAPAGELTVGWPGIPFEDTTAKHAGLRADFTSGIASLEEVRPGLGYGSMMMGDKPQEPQGPEDEGSPAQLRAKERGNGNQENDRPQNGGNRRG